MGDSDIFPLFSMLSRCILHTSLPPGILLCVKTDSMNRSIVDCSRYLFWFHIIDQSGTVLLVGQSEKVTIYSQFQVVDICH